MHKTQIGITIIRVKGQEQGQADLTLIQETLFAHNATAY